MRLIVTRPAAQAAAWVGELRALGCDAVALPLIEIAPLADTAPLQAAWHALGSAALVMFVSANAVAQFFAARPAGAAWPASLRGASTGPGTSAALRAAGVTAIAEPPAEAARFDSEALWATLVQEDWAGRRVLVVRGEEGRDWFAETLRERGATVDFVAAYARRAPRLDAQGATLLARALAEPQAHGWLFSSSEAVGHLRALAPQAGWQASRALASHPRIARSARELGFGRVDEAPPSVAAAAAWAASDDARSA